MLSEEQSLKISENGAATPLKRKLGLTSPVGSYPELQISTVSKDFWFCEVVCLYSHPLASVASLAINGSA